MERYSTHSGSPDMSQHHSSTRATRIPRDTCPMTGDVLLVGEDNPQSAEDRFALYHYPPGCAGNRLQEKIFQLEVRTYLSMWRTNLCVGGWRIKAATEAARTIVVATRDEHPWRVIVLLGAKVQMAFSRALGEGVVPVSFGASYLSPPPTRQVVAQLVSLPHPSGRNRVWNLPGTVEDARKLMNDVVPEIPWGELGKEGVE